MHNRIDTWGTLSY